MEQDVMHVGYAADVVAHLPDIEGKRKRPQILVLVTPSKTLIKQILRDNLMPTNLRMAAANRWDIQKAVRTPIKVFQTEIGACFLWLRFVMQQSFDDSEKFILGFDLSGRPIQSLT